MEIFSVSITDDDIRDHMLCIDRFFYMPDDEFESVLKAILDDAEGQSDSNPFVNGFKSWLYKSEHYDKIWEAIEAAIEDYISSKADEILKED